MKFIGGKAEKKLKCECLRDREFYPYYLFIKIIRFDFCSIDYKGE